MKFSKCYLLLTIQPLSLKSLVVYLLWSEGLRLLTLYTVRDKPDGGGI